MGTATRATPATRAAQAAAIEFAVHTYAHDARSDYGTEVIRRLGLDPARVFKTLVAVAGDYVVAVLPVRAQLDLKALGHIFGAKHAEMARPADAQRVTGYVLGGISPLGQKRRLPTVVDAMAEQFETVYVSGGRRGLEVELAPQDLVRLTEATLAEVARW